MLDTDVSCIVQWGCCGTLHQPASTMTCRMMVWSYETPWSIWPSKNVLLFWRTHTPRTSFLLARCLMMMNYLRPWDWRKEKEMKGGDPGEKVSVLCANQDDGQHIEPDEFWDTCKRQVHRCHLSSVCKMGRRSPSASPSTHKERRSKKIILLTKYMVHKSLSSNGWKDNPVWKPGLTTEDSWSSQAWWTKEDERCRGGRKRQLSSMNQGYKSQKGELRGRRSQGKSQKGCWAVQRTAEPATAKRINRKIKAKLLDCFNDWVKNCNEAGEIHERKRPQEEELKECFERHRLSW